MKHNEMFGKSIWIDCPEGDISPIFLKRFEAVKGEKAEIIICGLGFFELKINGKRVSDDLLVPSASNYSYRDMSDWSYPLFDDMSFRTYVLKYDISDFLIDSNNVMTVMLGTGYYHQNQYLGEGNVDYGTPKLCYIIKKASGDVLCDKTTLTNTGFFKRCNLYFGEYQDYTILPEEKDFYPSREIDSPETDFEFQIAPADKVVDTITDIKFIGENDGFKYYDVGINTVGRAVLKCDIPGEHFVIDYAEEIGGGYWNGIHFSDKGAYKDEFISDGKQEEYHSLFSWQGFRYIRVKGNAIPLRIDVIHSDINITSDFKCNNEVINWLYKTYVYTQLSNMHSGIPSDCPHRERLGYTGDGQLCAESGMLMLDTENFYRKWLKDISDCQCKKSGHVQHTAPAMGGGGGPCGWGGAIVEVPYRFYKYYGDKTVLEEFFPKMLRFFDYLESRSENGLVVREEENGWCLGDWLPPTPIQISETYVNTCLYVRYMQQVLEIASILGRDDEVSYLPDRITKVKKAIDNSYFSFQQRAYNGDINGASSLALDIGLGNDNVKNKVIEKYKNLQQYDTGIIATDVLTRYLFEIGESQLAYDLMSNDNEVSFYHMMKSGATTLWENWDGQSSRNHPMFGAVTKLLFTKILGIEQPKDSCGFESVVISPRFVKGLDNVSGFITTVNGKISVSFIVNGDTATVNICCDSKIKSSFRYGDLCEDFNGDAEFIVKI